MTHSGQRPSKALDGCSTPQFGHLHVVFNHSQHCSGAGNITRLQPFKRKARLKITTILSGSRTVGFRNFGFLSDFDIRPSDFPLGSSSKQMAEFFLHFLRAADGLGDFGADQIAVALAETVHSDRHGS